MIGSVVVVVFVVLLLCGVMGLCVAALRRKRMSFPSYRRVVGVSTFTVFVGLWGALVGGMFWVAS